MAARYLRNARIFTGTGEDHFVTAFAVEDGRFIWAGDASEIPRGAEVRDLDAALVLPGLIDAHTHPTWIAMTVDAVACTVPAVHDIPQMLDALRRHPSCGRGDEAWIEGWGYDESKLAERRPPTRHDLDRVSTRQPVYVLRSDCHSGVCNTRALELAGVTRDTPDPDGASFGRDEDGTPNGVLTELAANQVVLRAKGSAGFDAEAAALVRTSAHLAERGIVAVADMFCVPGEDEPLDLYRAAQARGFRQHAGLFYSYADLAERPTRPIGDDPRTGRVRVAGLKLFMDGCISNRTAWMRRPYRGSRDGTGMRTATDADLAGALRMAREHRLQIAVHAMGDRAIEHVVDAYGDEDPWLNGFPSVRIEHATVLDDALIERIRTARMRFGVVTNVNFFFAEYDSYAENLTDDQFSRTYPVRDLVEHHDEVALSSDCPATTWADPADPFMSIQAAVTRRAYNGQGIVPEQAVSVGQALLMYTGRAARVSDFGGAGVIRPGHEASFVTLSEDLFEMDPATIMDTRVTGTWIAGEQVHALGAQPAGGGHDARWDGGAG